MVDDVTQLTINRLAGTEYPKLLSRTPDLAAIAAQADKRRVEPGHEFSQTGSAIAFGIERDE